MKKLKIVLFVLLGAILFGGGWMFAISNPGEVTVNFLVGSGSAKIYAVVFIAFALGGLLGLLTSMGLSIRLAWYKRGSRKKIKKVEDELSHLKVSSKLA